MELRVRFRSEGELAADVGPLFLRIINGAETTDAAVDRLFAQLDAMLECWPLVAVLVVVEHGTPQPSPEIRLRVDIELRAYGEKIIVGYAFLGLGFWNSAARQFGAERAAALGVPVVVEHSIHELAQRIAFELIGVDAELIERSFEQLRASL